MRYLFSVIFLLQLSLLLQGQGSDLQRVYNEAKDAYTRRDYQSFYTRIKEANALHPYHQGILYHCGIAAALVNKPDEAVNFLAKAVQINAGYDLTVTDLKTLDGFPSFEKLKQQQRESVTPIIHSDTAFVLKNKTAHIESIATGKKKGQFFLGSIHDRKVIEVNERGHATDFCPSGIQGMASVFGVRVDTRNSILWACTSPVEQTSGYDTTLTSAIFKFNLKTRQLIRKYEPVETKGHVFGDLTLLPDGTALVSDSKTGSLYVVNEKSGMIDEFLHSDSFWSVQGIAPTPDGKYLFIADYVKGLFRLDLRDRSLVLIQPPADLSMKGIDGIAVYKNSVIGIQNGIAPMRVTRFFLDPAFTKVTATEIIDRAHPAFNEPTIGCLDGDQFYYVANSLWSGYTKDHQLKPEAELQEVVILTTRLK